MKVTIFSIPQRRRLECITAEQRDFQIEGRWGKPDDILHLLGECRGGYNELCTYTCRCRMSIKKKTLVFMCLCMFVHACRACAREWVSVCDWAVWQVEGCECSLSWPSPDYSAPFIKVSPPWQPLINILPQTPTRTWQRTTLTHTHTHTPQTTAIPSTPIQHQTHFE